MGKSIKLKDGTYWDSSTILMPPEEGQTITGQNITTLDMVSTVDQYSIQNEKHMMSGIAVDNAIKEKIRQLIGSNN